jgi:transaldolase/glucose-6-phosphate isomerase
VNTVPPQTLAAFSDHGKADLTIEKGLTEAKTDMLALKNLGISIEKVTDDLEAEGVKAFIDAFATLMAAIEEKASKAVAELGCLEKEIRSEAKQLELMDVVKRMFDIDPTLWTSDPAGQAEIKKRCNWLFAPWEKVTELNEIKALRKHCQNSGITHVLLLGMGGSSLAPEVMRLINGVTELDGIPGLDLAILDSTDPGQVKAALDRSPVEKTLYIVSSKSGGTAEVNAYSDFFWAKCEEKFGKKAGDQFIAITDPGTALEKSATEKGYWHIYKGDPMVGGRNSALTMFGLVPAALIGMDVEKLLASAKDLADQSVPEVPFGANPGAMLGAIMGAAWKAGKDKLTILTDPAWESFGAWMEQLIAESSGKAGKGIVPLAKEPLQSCLLYTSPSPRDRTRSRMPSSA